jgi:hypothetical protein
VIRPFPFDALPHWTREQVALLARALRHLAPVNPPTPDARWTRVWGGVPAVRARPPRGATADELQDLLAQRSLMVVLDHTTLDVLLVAIDRTFAMSLAARTLGADARAAASIAVERPLRPAYEGALMVMAAQLASAACAPSPPPVVRAVVDDSRAALAAFASPAAVVIPFHVQVGDEAGEVALIVSARALIRSGQQPAPSLAALSDCVVKLAFVLARQSLAAHGVASLEANDLLVIDPEVAFAGETLRGTIWLGSDDVAWPLGRTGADWTIDGVARTTGAVMERDARAVPPEAIGELRVEVEVVLAERSFRIEEVAAWRVGEVVAFEARIGDPVVIRAGGHTVARGELCDVDGSVAVRVTERNA